MNLNRKIYEVWLSCWLLLLIFPFSWKLLFYWLKNGIRCFNIIAALHHCVLLLCSKWRLFQSTIFHIHLADRSFYGNRKKVIAESQELLFNLVTKPKRIPLWAERENQFEFYSIMANKILFMNYWKRMRKFFSLWYSGELINSNKYLEILIMELLVFT